MPAGISEAPTRFTVELDLPPKELGPNYKPATVREKACIDRLRADYRRACAARIRQAGIPPQTGRVWLSWDFFLWQGGTAAERFCRSGFYFPRDESNALSGVKAAQDALVDAGIVPDDNRHWVKVGGITLHRGRTEHERRTCLVLTIEKEYPCE